MKSILVAIVWSLFLSGSASRYDVVFDGETWLRGADTFFHANSKLYTTADGTLQQHGDPVSWSGQDSLGPFTAQTTQYTAAGQRVETSVRSYRHDGLTADILTQTFVDGLSATAAATADDVISGFPSLQVGSSAVKLGYVAYNGLFVGWDDMSYGLWTRDLPRLVDGLSSGPLLLLDTSGQVVVISAFNEFMAASYTHNTTLATVSWGVMGKVKAVPAGFTYSTLVYFSKRGFNKAMLGWGGVLQRWYKRSSSVSADISSNYIGYYTDNGAYYYQIPESGMNFEQTLLAVYNHSQTHNIPYRYIQYDDWFYPTAGPTGYGATVEWDAKPSVFPHGLQYVYNVTNLPVVAHNRYWSDKTPYAKQNGGKFEFLFDGQGNAIPDDQGFWDWLMSRAKQWGLVTYEQDWLNYQVESIEAMHSDLTLAGRWLKQMGEAARRYGLTVQYCMALPRHLLASLQIDSVTQVRASIDYLLEPSQYKIGLTSLFIHALGLRPFKDNFWTTRDEPGNRYNKTEDSPTLQAVIALLSCGPVGVSDKINLTDVDLVQRLAAADGLLLQPSHPATAIDSQMLQALFGGDIGPSGEVWTTASYISGWTFGIVLAHNLQQPFLLYPQQTGWSRDFAASFVYSSKYFMRHNWQPPTPFNDDSPVHLATCSNYTSYCLYYSAPVFTVGSVQVYLAGELDKAVPVSVKRVLDVSVSSVDVRVSLHGTPREQVNFDVCQVDAAQRASSCTTVKCIIGDTGDSSLSALGKTCS